MPLFIVQPLIILVLIGMVFFDNARHVSCGGIFNMASSAAASEFCKIQVGMDVFIPHLGQASLIFMFFT